MNLELEPAEPETHSWPDVAGSEVGKSFNIIDEPVIDIDPVTVNEPVIDTGKLIDMLVLFISVLVVNAPLFDVLNWITDVEFISFPLIKIWAS
jgi:hypothetical protein